MKFQKLLNTVFLLLNHVLFEIPEYFVIMCVLKKFIDKNCMHIKHFICYTIYVHNMKYKKRSYSVIFSWIFIIYIFRWLATLLVDLYQTFYLWTMPHPQRDKKNLSILYFNLSNKMKHWGNIFIYIICISRVTTKKIAI